MDRINITFKKSPVKFGKKKTLLFEVNCSWEQGSISFFTDRSRYAEVKEDPAVIIEIVNSIGGFSETLEEGLHRSANLTITQKGLFCNKKYDMNHAYKKLNEKEWK